MKPPKSILHAEFKYTPAHSTNIRLTFNKVRRDMATRDKLVHLLLRPPFVKVVK